MTNPTETTNRRTIVMKVAGPKGCCMKAASARFSGVRGVAQGFISLGVHRAIALETEFQIHSQILHGLAKIGGNSRMRIPNAIALWRATFT
ncbi:MAG: hypothetical protein Fur0043_21400 [Anaerolineales bacterium]